MKDQLGDEEDDDEMKMQIHGAELKRKCSDDVSMPSLYTWWRAEKWDITCQFWCRIHGKELKKKKRRCSPTSMSCMQSMSQPYQRMYSWLAIPMERILSPTPNPRWTIGLDCGWQHSSIWNHCNLLLKMTPSLLMRLKDKSKGEKKTTPWG